MRALGIAFLAVACARKRPSHHGEDLAQWVRSHEVGPPRDAALEETMQRVRGAIMSLVDYYEGDEAIMREASQFDSPGLVRGLEAKLAALAVSPRVDKKLVVAALGSSVTAGHDLFGSTAWPAVLERRLATALRPLGIAVEVRNLAVGGREPFPASVCLSTIAGGDVDVIVREWEYWDFGDGLEVDGPKGEFGAVETFLRTALALPNRPAVYFVQLDVEGSGSKTARLLKAFRPTTGELTAYANAGSISVFSAFSTPFDHFRAKMPHTRRFRSGDKDCKGANVGECPVDYNKPDGHHSHAAWDGFDVSNAEWAPLLSHVRPSKLFINWHPGALGHEVVGHQLAYAALRSLERGLERLAKLAQDTEATRPLLVDDWALPEPSKACAASRICKSAVQCAVSVLPTSSKPDVGDWVDNSTQPTRWRNAPTAEARKQAEACERSTDCTRGPASDNCFHIRRKCSYADSKRGFSGRAADGPLLLSVPLPPGHSIVYITEATYAWSKPRTLANWHRELAVRVDGEVCTACTIAQGSGNYVQALRVDVAAHRKNTAAARALRGSPKSKNAESVAISITVRPVVSFEAYERDTSMPVCAKARNGRCEPKDEWRRYDLKCQETSPCSLADTAKLRDPAAVETFVSFIVTY